MTTNTYILLRDSNNFERRFRVPMGTLEPYLEKMQTNDRTVTGRADTQEGPHIAYHALQVRVRNIASGSDPDDQIGLPAWGVLADLRHFYGLKNPRGVPHNRLIYIDHLGVEHQVKISGRLGQNNITHVLDGDESWYYITLTMESIDSVAAI
jgi:hypothetical protein